MLAYNVQNIQTATFDGPIELLLYLINKQGIDIREIQIAPITDAFMAYLETLEMMNLKYNYYSHLIPTIILHKQEP